jgi:hypothetical protein
MTFRERVGGPCNLWPLAVVVKRNHTERWIRRGAQYGDVVVIVVVGVVWDGMSRDGSCVRWWRVAKAVEWGGGGWRRRLCGVVAGSDVCVQWLSLRVMMALTGSSQVCKWVCTSHDGVEWQWPGVQMGCARAS